MYLIKKVASQKNLMLKRILQKIAPIFDLKNFKTQNYSQIFLMLKTCFAKIAI